MLMPFYRVLQKGGGGVHTVAGMLKAAGTSYVFFSKKHIFYTTATILNPTLC